MVSTKPWKRKNLNEKTFHIKLPAYLEWILMTLSYHFAMCFGKLELCRWWLLLVSREEKCLRDYFPINKLEKSELKLMAMMSQKKSILKLFMTRVHTIHAN